MANLYYYIAYDPFGDEKIGHLEADDMITARRQLIKSQLLPTKIKKQITWKRLIHSRLEKPSDTDFHLWARKLSMLLSAGLGLTEATQVLINETENKKMLAFLTNIHDGLNRGANFSDAVSLQSYELPAVLVHYIHLGETTGTLAESLIHAADVLERRQQWQRDIMSQLLYPFVILLLMAFISFILLFFLFPTLAQTYGGLHAEPPLYLQLMLNFADLIMANRFLFTLLLIVFLNALIFSAYCYVQKNKQRKAFWQQVFAIPYLGPLMSDHFLAQFSEEVAMLLRQGNSFSSIYKLLYDFGSSMPIKASLEHAQTLLMQGQSLKQSFAEFPFFTPTSLEMLAIAEQTGELESMFFQISRYYSESIKVRKKTIARSVEPILIIGLGFLVLLFALMLFMPILESYDLFIGAEL